MFQKAVDVRWCREYPRRCKSSLGTVSGSGHRFCGFGRCPSVSRVLIIRYLFNRSAALSTEHIVLPVLPMVLCSIIVLAYLFVSVYFYYSVIIILHLFISPSLCPSTTFTFTIGLTLFQPHYSV